MAKKTTQTFDGPRRSPVQSIRSFCRRCQGLQPAQHSDPVRDCVSARCRLRNFRLGGLSADSGRSPLECIRRHCLDCAEGRKDVSACEMNRAYMSADPCPLWPFRRGTNPYLATETRRARSERAKAQPRVTAGDGRFASQATAQEAPKGA